MFKNHIFLDYSIDGLWLTILCMKRPCVDHLLTDNIVDAQGQTEKRARPTKSTF